MRAAVWAVSGKSFVLAIGLLPVLAMNVAEATRHGPPGPHRVWGDITTNYRVRQTEGPDATSWRNTGTISASSYIYRPWFALVSGSLSLSVDETEFDRQPPVEDEFTTGRFQFDLFPPSRFPFSLYAVRDRSQLEDTTFDRDVTTTRYGARQQYRSRDGMHHYRARYENDRQRSGELDNFEANRINLAASNQFGRHAFSTDVEFDEVDEKIAGNRADNLSITELHTYRDADAFSLENLVSTSRTENEFGQSLADIDTAQLNSFLAWRPADVGRLRLTGSLRLSETRISEQLAATPTMPPAFNEVDRAIANVNQGLIYEYSDNLVLSESLNANYVDNGGEIIFVGNESFRASYSGDRITLGLGEYGWSLSSSLTNRHGDIETQQTLGNQFRHSLARVRTVKDAYQLRLNLAQALNYDFESALPDERGIDHTFNVSWSDLSSRDQSTVSFGILDSRTYGAEAERRQIYNLQYSGTFRIDRYSRLAGNLTLQQSERSDGEQRTRRTVSNGQLEFSHDRLFGVHNLSLRSKLRLSKQQSETERFIADLSADPGTETALLNALHYRIGKLETRLNVDFVELDGETDRLLRFYLKRSFGDL